MSAERFVIIVVIALAAATLTLARTIRSVNLEMAVNKTVCPIKVEIDEDEDRVPRRIKVLKCAPEPNRLCESHHNQRLGCCQHRHSVHSSMECVEMRDRVAVYYKSIAKMDTYEVSVGCTCMIEKSTEAPELPPGPG